MEDSSVFFPYTALVYPLISMCIFVPFVFTFKGFFPLFLWEHFYSDIFLEVDFE